MELSRTTDVPFRRGSEPRVPLTAARLHRLVAGGHGAQLGVQLLLGP